MRGMSEKRIEEEEDCEDDLDDLDDVSVYGGIVTSISDYEFDINGESRNEKKEKGGNEKKDDYFEDESEITLKCGDISSGYDIEFNDMDLKASIIIENDIDFLDNDSKFQIENLAKKDSNHSINSNTNVTENLDKKKATRESDFDKQVDEDKRPKKRARFCEFGEVGKNDYQIIEKVGEGTFSEVWKAKSKKDGSEVALKRLYPTCKSGRILQEANILKKLAGRVSTPCLLDLLHDREQFTFVLPYLDHVKFADILPNISFPQVRLYMRKLFECLWELHKLGICHRDIKPGNFLYNPKTSEFLLVDFGLAQYEKDFPLLPQQYAKHFPKVDSSTQRVHISLLKQTIETKKRKRTLVNSRSMSPPFTRSLSSPLLSPRSISPRRHSPPNPFTGLHHPTPLRAQEPLVHPPQNRPVPRAGTRGFRAPEVLMRSPWQTTAIDIWSAGVVLLSLLTRRYPFFISPDDSTALCEIASLRGSQGLAEFGEKIGRRIHFPCPYSKWELKTLCEQLCDPPFKEEVPTETYSLLESCLDVCPYTRITAGQALQHPLFK